MKYLEMLVVDCGPVGISFTEANTGAEFEVWVQSDPMMHSHNATIEQAARDVIRMIALPKKTID